MDKKQMRFFKSYVLSIGVFIAVISLSSCKNTNYRGNLKTLSSDVYERAESMLNQNTSKLIDGAEVQAHWIDAENFWYVSKLDNAKKYHIVNTLTQTKKALFDFEKLAMLFATEFNFNIKSDDDLICSVDLIDKGEIILSNKSIKYSYMPENNSLTKVDAHSKPEYSVVSPDGNKAAFIRDFNLWIKHLDTGIEQQLTHDGEEFYGYATNNAGWIKMPSPVLLWSPNSKLIATFRHDSRYVDDMYLVSTTVGHPGLQAWKYPLPGDSLAFRIERIVIDIERKNVVKLDIEADQHRSTISDHIADREGKFLDVEWNEKGDLLSFVSSSRDHKKATLRVANPFTGDVRTVLEETVDTFYESGYRSSNWRVLPESNEVLWYSQKDDWGHLYLHDLNTGELKTQITSGNWKVLSLLKVNQNNRKLYFTACGKEPGDPYFQYLYSVKMDGNELALHTPDSANHIVSLSPDSRSFIDTYSTPSTPQISTLKYIYSTDVVELEKLDISQLLASGWVAPVPFSVKARDGITDLYGLLHKPSNFNENLKYPIINYIYPGPQSGSVGSRSFLASRGDRQAIAELGFIVIALDAMGTPMRSLSFHEANYGNMGDNGLPDLMGAIKQLSEKYKWIDIDKVGIYGHSGGGYASTAAMLQYPDFFDVAVSGAGNHDNRIYEDDWGEKWQGLLVLKSDGTDNYDNQANQLLAKNLKGKLLIAHGTMDSNVPPNNTLVLVNSLIEANKDFDLIMFPNRGHDFGNEPYMMRRRWDYFVTHLLGAKPPKGYKIGKK